MGEAHLALLVWKMVSEDRARRIARRIKEELSTLLLFNVSDPRLVGVYITDVRVDRELAFASIFVSAAEGAERKDEILEAFEKASGYLRRELSQVVDLRNFPRLRFNWDPTPEHAERIEELLDSLNVKKDEDEITDD